VGSPIGIYVSTDPCQPVLNPVCLLQGQRAEQSPHLQVRKGPALDSHRDG